VLDVLAYMRSLEGNVQRGREPSGQQVFVKLGRARYGIAEDVRAKYLRLYPREETVLDRILGREEG
jgi:hypothetical protein